MLFSSMLFIWIFLPIVLLGNFILGRLPLKYKQRIKLKNRFLLVASLVFYAWGGLYYLALMLAVIAVNFFGGLWLNEIRVKRSKAWALVLIIATNLGLLFYFKYFNLVISTIEAIRKMESGGLGLKEVVLPIGISFYIFQAMSYVIDLNLNKTKVQRNIFDFGLYVALFPQLIAGPIVQYKDIEIQLYRRKGSPEMVAEGIKRFCYGLAKKVIIANVLGETVDRIWESNLTRIGAGTAVLATVAYTLQIYYDFSGYSDMAIGLGKMLGFSFKENFNLPYLSASIREFWRRWHISLSSWFKEYVYIPLGGSRAGKGRTYLNLFIVFLLTGIWHGANYTFFFWGMYYALFIILERAFYAGFLEKHKWFGHIYAILVVSFGWIFFRAGSFVDALTFIGGFVRFRADTYSYLQFVSLKTFLALILGILFCGPVQMWTSKIYAKVKENAFIRLGDVLAQMALLLVCICWLTKGTYNPFIYFQF